MDLTNAARVCPVRPHAPTIPLPASNYRTAPPAYSQPSQRETTKSKLMHPNHSTRPKGWVEVLYFRNKAVFGLPISTTSYSQHVISTIQSPISTADNDRSLTDSDGAKTTRNPVLLPYLYTIITSRPVSYFHITIDNSGTVI